MPCVAGAPLDDHIAGGEMHRAFIKFEVEFAREHNAVVDRARRVDMDLLAAGYRLGMLGFFPLSESPGNSRISAASARTHPSQNHFNDVIPKVAERREQFWKQEKVGD